MKNTIKKTREMKNLYLCKFTYSHFRDCDETQEREFYEREFVDNDFKVLFQDVFKFCENNESRLETMHYYIVDSDLSILEEIAPEDVCNYFAMYDTPDLISDYVNFEFSREIRETVFNIANKYDFMKYFENVEIDCFCITLYETSINKILDFVSELNQAIRTQDFVLYYENHEIANDEYICVSTAKLFNDYKNANR